MIDESIQKQLREQYNPDGSMLREIQMYLLDILSEVDRVCRENGLTYWLDSGTLLGAVRHGGFIPWDDDIDICILRKDYKRFCKVMRECLRPPYKLYAIDYDSDYNHKWPRIVNENISVKRMAPDGAVREEKLWVDAFLMCNGHPSYVRNIDALYGRCFRRVHGIVDDGWLRRVAGFVAFPFATLLVMFSRLYGKTFHRDTLVHDYASGFYSIRKVDDIFPLSSISFEGRYFISPGNPEAYLKRVFGNYEELPSEDSRLTHNMMEVNLLNCQNK